ncbi:MAG: hypothetical protein PHE61_07685 [Candidatus Omnitrophica bacterium]|nr:hypothetical protein [Candidatus Omnitrophota bacterium]
MSWFTKTKRKKEKLYTSRLNFKEEGLRRKAVSSIDREIFRENRDMLYKREAIARSLGKQGKDKRK